MSVAAVSDVTVCVSDWINAAACIGYNPEWWCDDVAGHVEAVRICLTCPVRQPCLREARERHDVGVIRGGLWLGKTRHGYLASSPLCAVCGIAPATRVVAKADRRCHQCRVKANRANRRLRRQAAQAC